jgi:hypothetical protein
MLKKVSSFREALWYKGFPGDWRWFLGNIKATSPRQWNSIKRGIRCQHQITGMAFLARLEKDGIIW